MQNFKVRVEGAKGRGVKNVWNQFVSEVKVSNFFHISNNDRSSLVFRTIFLEEIL